MMNISARNVLKGRITKIVHGAVNTEVTLRLPGDVEIVSVITKSSAERLKLSEGVHAYAVIKASNVMIGVD